MSMLTILGKKFSPGWFEILFLFIAIIIGTILPRIFTLVNIPWNTIYSIFGKIAFTVKTKTVFILSFIIWPVLITYFIGYGIRVSCYFILLKKYVIFSYIYIIIVILSFFIIVSAKWYCQGRYLYMTM